jgi:hypothetical protein
MLKTEQERDSGKGIAPSRISQRWIRIIPVALIMYTIAFNKQERSRAFSSWVIWRCKFPAGIWPITT